MQTGEDKPLPRVTLPHGWLHTAARPLLMLPHRVLHTPPNTPTWLLLVSHVKPMGPIADYFSTIATPVEVPVHGPKRSGSGVECFILPGPFIL